MVCGRRCTQLPSFSSNFLLSQMKPLRKLMMNMKMENTRKYQDLMGELGAKALKGKVRYEKEYFDNFEAETAYPVDMRNFDYVMLYLHGGAYTAGSLSYARGFGGVLAEYFHVPVLCAAYRLAPEEPYPAALEDVLEAYMRLEQKYGADKIYLVGESAGGGLCFSLCLKLKEQGTQMPCGCIALSPWTDLTFSGASYKTNEKTDPSLFENVLRRDAEMYRGEVPADDPYISPLFADTAGFCPVMIIAGTIELLLDDSSRMAEKLKNDGVTTLYRTYDGMWHVFVLFPLPESKEAMAEMKKFIDSCERDKLDKKQR